MAKLAIQVLLYRSSPHLAPLLESLRVQTFRDFEVWFYENSEDAGEAQRERALVEGSGLPQQFIVGEKNSGFAGGHEALYRRHEAPFVLLLNDDALLEPGYLAAAMRRIESDPKIGSVTGLVYRSSDAAERVIDTAGLEYHCLGKIVDRFAGRRASEVADVIPYDCEIFGVSGAVGLYRRSAIDQAGGLFDPRWFMYKEDADLAIRLRRAGFVAWFEPRAVAFHQRGLKEEQRGIFKRLANERARAPILRAYSYANQWRIYRRHFRMSLGVRDISATIWAEALRSAMVFFASPRVFVRAWRMFLTNTPYVA